MREEYEQRQSNFRNSSSLSDVEDVCAVLEDDLLFLTEAHSSSLSKYSSILDKLNASSEKAKSAAWDCVEYSELLKQVNDITGQLKRLKDYFESNVSAIKENMKKLYRKYQGYLRDLYKKKRQAASHVMVIMVSEEKRDRKPYAMPVQYVPYRNIRDQYVRDLLVELKREMVKLEMDVVGEGTIQTLKVKNKNGLILVPLR